MKKNFYSGLLLMVATFISFQSIASRNDAKDMSRFDAAAVKILCEKLDGFWNPQLRIVDQDLCKKNGKILEWNKVYELAPERPLYLVFETKPFGRRYSWEVVNCSAFYSVDTAKQTISVGGMDCGGGE